MTVVGVAHNQKVYIHKISLFFKALPKCIILSTPILMGDNKPSIVEGRVQPPLITKDLVDLYKLKSKKVKSLPFNTLK